VIDVARLIDESRLNRFHCLVLVLSFAATTFDGYDLVLYGAAVPLLIEEWSLAPVRAGVIGSYALIGAAVGALIFGRLADKFGRKSIILACVILFSFSTGLAGIARSPEQFGFCRFSAGLGIGGFLPNIFALVAEYSPARHRALMVALTSSGMQIGGVAAAGLSMWLFPVYGWRSVFWAGAAALILVPVLARHLPDSALHYIERGRIERLENVLKRIRPEVRFEKGQHFQIGSQGGRSPARALFQEHRYLSTVLIWIIYAMSMYMIFGLGTWLPKLMMDAGYPLGSGLWFLLTLNLGAFGGSNFSGLLADRVGVKRTLVALFLLAFVSIALLSLKTNIYVLTSLVALAGTGFFGGINVANSYVPSFYPPGMRSTAMGFALGIGRIGAILGPTVSGILVSRKYSLTEQFLWLAAPGLIACAAILLVQDKHSYRHAGREVLAGTSGG